MGWGVERGITGTDWWTNWKTWTRMFNVIGVSEVSAGRRGRLQISRNTGFDEVIA
jgi:hypothetical protein